MDDDYRFRSWFVEGYGWAKMCPPAAALLLAFLPPFFAEADGALVLAYTLLPAYMVHQYEEHARGALRPSSTPGSAGAARCSPGRGPSG